MAAARRLHRGTLEAYVQREVVAPAGLGFVVYTSLLMLQVLFSLAEEVFVGGTAMGAALRLFVDAVPHAIVLTIPMSFLFGVIIALGRLNGDREITALQAAGLPVRRLFRPVLRMAVLLSALNLVLTLFVLPAANRDLKERKTELLASSNVIGTITPRVIYDEIPGMLLYVHDIDEETGEWQDVLVYDRSDEDVELLMVADRGHLATRSAPGVNEPPWLVMEGVVTHRFDPERPDTYRLNTNQTQLVRLPIPVHESIAVNFSRHELSTRELIERAAAGANPDDPVDVEEHRYAVFEIHQRLAIPVACLTFGLLGVPFGVGARSGGRGQGFLLSILAVLVYYVLYNHGEVLALVGRVPVWVGAWLPNTVLLGLAAILAPRMGRWLGERRGRSRVAVLVQGVQAWRRRRQLSRVHSGGTAVPITGSIPIALQRRTFAPRFPVQLDRYLVGGLVAPFAGMIVTTAMLYVAVDVADKIDRLTKASVSVGMFVVYYKNLLPQVIANVTPMALMISVLVMFTLLERRSELTALKACGISMYRAIVPVVLVALVCVGGLAWFQEEVLPDANRRALIWKDRIKGRSTARSSMANDRQWLFSRDGSMLYNFLSSDPDAQRLIRLSVFRFDASRELRLHLFAEEASWRDGDGWVASDGWMRRINLDGSDEFLQLSGEVKLPVPEGPDYFGQEVRLPEELGYVELGRYIEEMIDSGYRPTKMIVRWHQKVTSPLAALVLVLLALPYALSQGGRTTTTQGVAVAVFLGIGYLLLVMLCGWLGDRGTLPPSAAAWAPVVTTTLFAINRLTLLKT